MRSIAVWRSPSRLPTSVAGGAAFTTSVESIVPLPSWSIPRPPAGIVTGVRPARTTVIVPRGPPPCPTTLIATVATPFAASIDATAIGAPCFESVKP
jgi:hypothetical protein